MAKVGRAAYAASRARLEVVTADKTISVNESGELYAVDAGSTVDITLPSNPQDGTRYKFMIIDDAAGAITITTGTTGTQPLQGAVAFCDSDGANTDIVKADGASTGDDTLTLAADTEQGSWVICVYDAANSRWLLEGWVSAATTPGMS